jgi:NTE family protein
MRDFHLKPGDAYNTNQIKAGIESIYNTQLFDKVSVNIKGNNDKRILLIKVKEKLYTVFRLGGKAGTERGAQGYFELGNENFLGISSKIAITARYGDYDRQIGVSYRMDRIFSTYLTFGINGYYQWALNPYYKSGQRTGEYREERSGVRILLGQQLQKLGQMSAELRIENAKDNTVSGLVDYTQNSELRTLTVRSITDKRDNIGFTTKGIYNVWYWEAGNEQILVGQEKFTKAFVNLEGYYTYWKNHTFHVRGVIGVGDKTLPFSEFFRIGGPDSFMGFHEYELYGRQIVFSNLEYRLKSPWQIFSETYVGLRYDVGGVWETPDLVMTSEDFFFGIGVWLGIDTALGPLMLTYGDSSVKDGVIYLSLGYDF